MKNRLCIFAFLVAGLGAAWAQSPLNDPVPRSDSGAYSRKSSSPIDKLKEVPKHSQDESSSKDFPVDLSPPANDINHPGTDEEDAITELKPWDPHRAAKDLEVGEYYLKQKNYRGAMLRFRDALEFKPRDAEATYFLALTLEKSDEPEGAAQKYQEYLEILPNGPRAEEARKGLERTRKSGEKSAASETTKDQKKD